MEKVIEKRFSPTLGDSVSQIPSYSSIYLAHMHGRGGAKTFIGALAVAKYNTGSGRIYKLMF